jgi:hypothetical protein
MWSLATNRFIVEMIEKMLGEKICLYASQLHRKESSRGHEVPWHQDGNDKVRTVWITLDDVDRYSIFVDITLSASAPNYCIVGACFLTFGRTRIDKCSIRATTIDTALEDQRMNSLLPG